MTETLTVRFFEVEAYDPIKDAHMVTLQAVTSHGTWFSRVPLVDSAATMRTKRDAFQKYVLGAMSMGQLPHEVSIG